jgi:hypothetical protein
MELDALLAGPPTRIDMTTTEAQHPQHSYPTRRATSTQNPYDGYSTPPVHATLQNGLAESPNPYSLSPQSPANPKNVAFELCQDSGRAYRARLPMRVQIFPHDTTESIITTVKNFYGIYDGQGPGGARGVSFEDEQGITLIARYENFSNNMSVFVRVVQTEPVTYNPSPYYSPPQVGAHQGYYPEDNAMNGAPPSQALTYGNPPSRPASRTARMRSISPHDGRGRRSASVNGSQGVVQKKTPQAGRSRSGAKSRTSSTHHEQYDLNGDAMYSSGDDLSVTSSKRNAKGELASAEISLDNIVEGGRRKRAKFESSVSAKHRRKFEALV